MPNSDAYIYELQPGRVAICCLLLFILPATFSLECSLGVVVHPCDDYDRRRRRVHKPAAARGSSNMTKSGNVKGQAAAELSEAPMSFRKARPPCCTSSHVHGNLLIRSTSATRVRISIESEAGVSRSHRALSAGRPKNTFSATIVLGHRYRVRTNDGLVPSTVAPVQ